MASEIFSGHRIVDHFQGSAALPASAADPFMIIEPRRGENISDGIAHNQATTLVDNETATAGTTKQITKAAAGWSNNVYVGEIVLILDDLTQPTNIGHMRIISSNDGTNLNFLEPLPQVANNSTVFAVYQKSRFIPIVRAVELHHIGTAGSLSMTSHTYQGSTTIVQNTLYAYNAAATSGISITGGGIMRVGQIGGDVRAQTVGAMTGTIFVEGYWINNSPSLTSVYAGHILTH